MALDIAVDFDGTCVKHKFPEIGEDIGAVPVLKKLVEAGHRLILFTMRSDGQKYENVLADAVKWFEDNDIPLYAVNHNPEQDEWTSSPKAHADLYLDDRGFGVPLLRDDATGRPYVNWEVVEKGLTQAGLIKPPPGMMSTGDPATLGNYLKMSNLFFGEDSKSSEFLRKTIEESPNGADEEVITEESQTVHMLMNINFGAIADEQGIELSGGSEEGSD
jgi:hypothetical protein